MRKRTVFKVSNHAFKRLHARFSEFREFSKSDLRRILKSSLEDSWFRAYLSGQYSVRFNDFSFKVVVLEGVVVTAYRNTEKKKSCKNFVRDEEWREEYRRDRDESKRLSRSYWKNLCQL